MFGEGTLDLGKETKPAPRSLAVETSDTVVLAVDARDGNHGCDLTEIDFIITTYDKPERTWNLAADVANSIRDGNPHADQYGHSGTWSFVSGVSKPPGSGSAADTLIPADSIHNVLARVLVSPAFLFRIEQAPAGKTPQRVNDWELATRLSYFLWSSCPDDELRKLAATGQLKDSQVLSNQVQRMLKDDRLRTLAIEFGTQWIHVRGFDEFKEKNETLFPSFTPDFRKVVYEESILFFQDLFQNDRPVTGILDADYTFLNEQRLVER